MTTKEKLQGLKKEDAIIEFAKIYSEKNNKANSHGVGHNSFSNMKYIEFRDTISMISEYNKSGYDYFTSLDRAAKMDLFNKIKSQC